jgi:hypothetical protein
MDIVSKRQADIAFPDSTWTLRIIVRDNEAVHFQLFWKIEERNGPTHEFQVPHSAMLELLQGPKKYE